MKTGTGPTEGPILVPVDFSAHSLAAVAWAADLAAQLGAPLHLLHVVHDPLSDPGSYYREGDPAAPSLEAAAEAAFATFLERAESEVPALADVARAHSLVVGLPVGRILEVADRLAARLVVVGSQGLTGLPRFMLGSTAQKLVQLCPVPVVVVKSPARHEPEGAESA